MTTRRKTSQATGRLGINYVRSLVERNNSTFQEIELHNDLGNDAYIEFVRREEATGCCIAVQIKSGASYRTGTGRYIFYSDRDHFQYWAAHVLPVVCIIFDPESDTAYWTDITEHIKSKSVTVEEGPWSVEADKRLDDSTFEYFADYCMQYRKSFADDMNFGRALANLSSIDDAERCFDGLYALFSFHRNKLATWYYLVSCLSNYRNSPILRVLVSMLSHIPGHGDIFWSSENILLEPVRTSVLDFMRERLDRRDALTLLSAIDDMGIDRGTIGQCVHSIVDVMRDADVVMESIAVDCLEGERIRHSAILFAAFAAQFRSAPLAMDMLDRIAKTVDGDLLDVVNWLKGDLYKWGRVAFY